MAYFVFKSVVNPPVSTIEEILLLSLFSIFLPLYPSTRNRHSFSTWTISSWELTAGKLIIYALARGPSDVAFMHGAVVQFETKPTT